MQLEQFAANGAAAQQSVDAALAVPHGTPDRQVKPALTPDERQLLEDCKTTIEWGREIFMQVGIAMMTVRDQRLYRETHNTFEAWCQDNYGWSARRARQLCTAAETVQTLKEPSNGNHGSHLVITNPAHGNQLVVPATERQARPLAGLPPEEQRQAWLEAVKTAPGGRLTAKHVQSVVDGRRARIANGAWDCNVSSDAYHLGTQAPSQASPEVKTDSGNHGSHLVTTNPPRLVVEVEPAGTRDDRRAQAADAAIQKVRELEDMIGTPDSIDAALVSQARNLLELFVGHQVKVARMHAERKHDIRVAEKGGL